MLISCQFNKIRKERNDKKAFAEALMHTQETERKRIAQDLHDGIGQSCPLEIDRSQSISLVVGLGQYDLAVRNREQYEQL